MTTPGPGTLQDIITKVRRLTGSGSDNQLTDAMIIGYINSFYTYDFPAQFRSLKLKNNYTFNTIQGVDTYPFDSEQYSTVDMPCYCMKREIKLFQDPWSFYAANFNWQQQDTITTGNGGMGPYAGNTTAFPLIASANNNPIVETELTPTTVFPSGYPVTFQNPATPSRIQNILITANTATSTLNVTDDGGGNLIGDCTGGTINYQTGAIANLNFTQIVPAGNIIQIQYNPQVLSIPLAILFYQNQFTLRPVPDQGYTVELVAYRLPSQALLGSSDPDAPNYGGVPELLEWWECIAAGAAKKIYEDRLDSEGVMFMDKMIKERYAIADTRTYAQIGKQRINTLFADQLEYNYGSGAGFLGQI
jgi:hypothetical protein